MKQTMYNSGPSLQRRSLGLALIELMIAMVLGLLLLGAAMGVMLSNTQSFRTTKSLSQIQNSSRLGFELMARDIRQAGSIPCGNDINVDNLISNSGSNWYLNWDAGQLIGYTADDTVSGLTGRVSGTQALTILYADNSGSSLTASGTHSYTFNKAQSGFKTNDIAFICDASKGSIFKSKISSGSGDNLIATAAAAGNLNTQPGVFARNSAISKLKSRAWYIGENPQGGSSLYIVELSGSGLSNPIEIASGVSNLTLRYRLTDTTEFKTASQVGSQWSLVNAVEVSLELLGQDQNVSTDSSADSGRLTRNFSSIVALRNRIL